MASGQTMLTFLPRAAEYSSIGRYSAATEALIGNEGHDHISFDPDRAEFAYFSAFMPRFYAGGQLYARYMWSAPGALSGSCVWYIALERQHGGISFDGEYTVNAYAGVFPATAATGAGHTVIYSDLPCSAPGLTGGERFRIYVARDGANGLDTMPGDAYLHSVEIREA